MTADEIVAWLAERKASEHDLAGMARYGIRVECACGVKQPELRGLAKRVGRDHGLILHAGARTGEGLLVVNLWPSRDGSEAAAADPRRLAALERSAVDPERFHREHHEVERYLVMAGERCSG